MKMILAAAMSAVLLSVLAATPVLAFTAKEARAQCKADAGSRAGAERKAFMRECVAAKKAANTTPPTEKQLAQRAKMRACSAEFRGTGKDKSERRAYLGECLKR